jgi:hypothetical protein
LANLKKKSETLNKKIGLTSKMLASIEEKEASGEPTHQSALITHKFRRKADTSLHGKVIEIATQLREKTGKPFRASELLRAVETAGLELPGKKSKLTQVAGMLAREMNRKQSRRLTRIATGLYDVINKM